jgi:hypothetical protein
MNTYRKKETNIRASAACVLLSVFVLFLMNGRADAQARAAKHGPRGLKITVEEEPTFVSTATSSEEVARRVFSEIERQIIDRYFGDDEDEETAFKARGKSKGLPPGLAKRETLPPGLARHVQMYGTLPPGLQKRDLPEDLEALLPTRPETEARVIIGDDVALIERATGLILDVIEDIVTGSPNQGSDDL